MIAVNVLIGPGIGCGETAPTPMALGQDADVALPPSPSERAADERDCQRVCAALSAVTCDTKQPPATCHDSCLGALAHPCGALTRALYLCLLEEPEAWSCLPPVGVVVRPTVCPEAQDAARRCLTSTPSSSEAAPS